MKKIIYSVMLLIAGAVSFTSCSDDDDNDKFPMLNKQSFVLTAVGDKDTLYTTDNGDYRLERVVMHSGEKEVGETLFGRQDKELKNGNEVIGSVEYSGGNVSRVSANDWFELKKIDVKGHDKAYEITRTGDNPMQLSATFHVFDTAPVFVTVK